jgi:hypothetical protein
VHGAMKGAGQAQAIGMEHLRGEEAFRVGHPGALCSDELFQRIEKANPSAVTSALVCRLLRHGRAHATGGRSRAISAAGSSTSMMSW